MPQKKINFLVVYFLIFEYYIIDIQQIFSAGYLRFAIK